MVELKNVDVHFKDGGGVDALNGVNLRIEDEERGTLFVGPGTEVYEGMIVGRSPRNEDIVVNVCKKKHVTNTRASGSDEALKLTPPTILSLEQSLEFITDDELVEVTPKSIRMRKSILSKELRMKKAAKK